MDETAEYRVAFSCAGGCAHTRRNQRAHSVGRTRFMFVIGLVLTAVVLLPVAAQAGSVKLVRDLPGSSSPAELTPFGGRLVYVAYTAETGRELGTSDGTEAGTKLVKDIWPGEEWSDPDEFAVMGGVLYFAANSPDHGRELWRSDGTRKGTRPDRGLESRSLPRRRS